MDGHLVNVNVHSDWSGVEWDNIPKIERHNNKLLNVNLSMQVLKKTKLKWLKLDPYQFDTWLWHTFIDMGILWNQNSKRIIFRTWAVQDWSALWDHTGKHGLLCLVLWYFVPFSFVKQKRCRLVLKKTLKYHYRVHKKTPQFTCPCAASCSWWAAWYWILS